MCLTTKKNKAMIAKGDIVVIKYLHKEGERYYTPCQGTPVELNSTMLPKIDYPEFRGRWSDNFGNEISNLHGGVIHVRITPDNMGNCRIKAIIPEGAKYWVDLTTKEIATTELQITDKPINKTDISIYYDLLDMLQNLMVSELVTISSKMTHLYIHLKKQRTSMLEVLYVDSGRMEVL